MKQVEEVEEVEELTQVVKPSREELKKKLRNKISQQSVRRRGGVSRKESQTLSDKIDKLLSFLKEENITVNTKLTQELVERITEIISKNDVKKILSQIDSNPEVSDNFKEFIKNLDTFKVS